MRGFKTGVHMEKPGEAADEKSCAGNQHKRDGNFRYHQRGSRTAARSAFG